MMRRVSQQTMVRAVRRGVAIFAMALAGAIAGPSFAAEPVFAFTAVQPEAVDVVARYFRSGDYLNVNAARKVPGLEERIGHDRLYKLTPNLDEFAEWAGKPCRDKQSAGVIIYGPEGWEATPAAEKYDRHGSVARAAGIARQSGCRTLGYAPSRAFLTDEKKGCGAPPGQFARAVDWRAISVFVVQAQGLLSDACQRREGEETYVRFVTEVARIARARNPSIVVLAEVSLNRASPEENVGAMRRVQDHVDGFYIAYPVGIGCKYCSPAALEQVLSSFRRPLR